MRFKSGESVFTTDPYYDLAEGYIDPAKLLEDEDEARSVADAVRLVREFIDAAESEGILEVG